MLTTLKSKIKDTIFDTLEKRMIQTLATVEIAVIAALTEYKLPVELIDRINAYVFQSLKAGKFDPVEATSLYQAIAKDQRATLIVATTPLVKILPLITLLPPQLALDYLYQLAELMTAINTGSINCATNLLNAQVAAEYNNTVNTVDVLRTSGTLNQMNEA